MMYESVYNYYDSVLMYVKVKTIPRLYAADAFRKVRPKSNFSHVGSECAYGQTAYVYTTQNNLNPNSNPMEHDRPKYDNPAACVIAQQYSSSTCVSLHLQFFKVKIRGPFKNVIFQFLTFLTNGVILILRTSRSVCKYIQPVEVPLKRR
jgi:hypothetical protein